VIRSVGSPTVLLAGGGTGGHLFPGVATAEELIRRAPGSRVLLAATRKDTAARHGLACDLETVAVQSPRTPSSRALYPLFATQLAAAVVRSARVLSQHRPHVVVGLGGYGSAAPVLAAWRANIPVLLLEQNAIPGRATRFLSRFGATVAASYPGLAQRGVRGTVVETGNPVRRHVLGARPSHETFGLVPGTPVLAVIGGSLGAAPLNRRLAAALPSLVERTGGRDADGRARFQVIHAAGTSAEAETLTGEYARAGVRAAVRPFFEDMDAVWGTADAVLSRAGGTTIAELSALGKPPVLVPYPHAADDHQVANARVLADRGAAVIVRESDLDAARVCAELGPLLADRNLREHRAAQARAFGRPDAAARVVDLILDLASRAEVRR